MYADLVLLLTALLAGGVIVAFVHSERAPNVNLRAQVIASVRIEAAKREIARLRTQLDRAWATADRRLDLLREVAAENGASARDLGDSGRALNLDEALALAVRTRIRRGLEEFAAVFCPGCSDPRCSHRADGLCFLCPHECQPAGACARRESCESHDVLQPLPLPAPREVQQ